MPLWLLGLGKGLALGFMGSGVKFCFTRRALQKAKTEGHAKAGKVLINCYYLRHVVNLIILVLGCFLFSTNSASLIGTALGLTLPKYILYVKKLY